jgi:hypothetical protein
MKKIRRIYLHKLRNEEWFNFFIEFKTFVEEVSPETLNIVELYAVFLVLFADADTALEKLRKSGFTATVLSLDEQRDDVFRGLTTAVESASHHFDPVLRNAANTLKLLWDHYGNLATRSFNEETAALINFIQELRGKFAPAIQTLGLVAWVDELERCNNAFEAVVLERNRDNSEQPDLHVLALRRKINRCYLDILERIEAVILLQGDDLFVSFVNQLNTNIDRYAVVLNRRVGTGKNKKSEKSEQGEKSE